MRRILRSVRHGQRGFTLIELLIVVAILGVIAAVVIPNVTAFMGSAEVNAANTEVQNVRTAVLGYLADYSDWPGSAGPPDNGDLAAYLTGDLAGTYTFDTDGLILTASYGSLFWDGEKFTKP
jgi:type IV pilus assembly protein PilA